MPRNEVKTPISQRKLPQQRRSIVMVDSILEATIRILKSSPEPKLTTSSIAGKAGISVGSLYQYFPNKQSIIAALIRWHSKDSIEKLKMVLKTEKPESLSRTIEILVRFAVDYHLDRRTIYKFMSKHLYSLDCEPYVAEARNRATDMIDDYCATHSIAEDHPQRRQAIYLSTIAVMGIVDYFIAIDDSQLSREDIYEQAQKLVSQYL